MSILIRSVLTLFVGALAFQASLSASQAEMHDKAEGTPNRAGSMIMGQQMVGSGLMMPSMDPERGRKLFASKGCVVCHAVNGVGGEDASPLDAATMPRPMNPFEFSARMWRGAEAMIYLQREELGEQIEFTGDELADIIAFVHDSEEQAKFSEADVPARMKDLMQHMEEGEAHEDEEGGHDADKPRE